MKPIRAIIIDDETPARRKIRRFLQKYSSVTIEDEAGDGVEALEKIESVQPDLVFLDIQMPRLNGLEMLDALHVSRRPHVIFTTAFDQFAVKAFEVRALDYLLKPFDETRFADAMERFFEAGVPQNDSIADLVAEWKNRQAFLERILIRSGGRITFLPVARIERIVSAEKYVELHADGEMFLHRATMKEMERGLDPSQFLRVHRSALVNKNGVKELHTTSHGDYIVVLKSGVRVNLGRTYRQSFFNGIDKPVSINTRGR